mmetsp:Transcript_14197/g.26783  ORF Transcript_14197/g.26783 Transcript_14197/m.26783 type:complete len:147 (+) Transcript_14197:472-912(+)
MFIKMLPAIVICFMYGASATIVTVCNKVLISNYAFRCPYTYLAYQYTLLIAGVELGKLSGFKMPKFSWKDLSDCFIVSLLFMINIVSGLFGLGLVNMPMYVALRKQVTLIVFMWDFFILKKEIRRDLVVGVFGMTAGAVIAGVLST